MKILQIAQCFPPAIGGVETHVYNISKGLVDRGSEVVVYCSNLAAANAESVLPAKYWNHEIDGIKVRRFPAFKLIKPTRTTIMPSMLFALLKEENIDIIHAHSYGYFPMYCSYLPSRMKRVPLVFTPHFSVETTVPSALRKIYDSSLGNLSLRSADRIIAITRTEKGELERITGFSSKISVIPNGVDVALFEDQTLGTKFKRKYGLQKDIVLFVGRLAYSKGLTYLFQAIPNVIEQYPDVHFVFVGKDWGIKETLVCQAKKLGVADCTIFTGPLFGNEFLGAYQAADVFVLPSIAGEAFGIVLLEAMAAGKPVIASNVGGICDLVTNNVNGFLVTPADAEALAENLLTLLRNKELAFQMGTINKLKAQKYSWKEIVKELEKLYDRLKARTSRKDSRAESGRARSQTAEFMDTT